ncbi:GMC family oxidoreductase (plasmid) [Rhodobacteraceae bacterium S2214]|nr:GMC family oxidoreductase [Rhodobacteraceae bacterium S2214]
MILDARQLPDGEELETDICIVGGGVAGITLALELSGTGLDVILLESGGMNYDPETQSLAAGPILGFQYDPLDDSRLRMLGGSSNHWAGNCMPLAPIDFEKRDEIPHSGWPISYDDLAPFYERAQPYFELQTERPYDMEYWAKEIGLDPIKFDPEIFVNLPINESPPTAFGYTYETALKQSPNISTYLYANVLDVLTNDTATTVKEVQVACIDGPRFRVRATRFVLAQGGIEIPRLMLLSNSTATAGLGNDYDLVGKFFGDHGALRPALTFFAQDQQDDLALYAQQHFFEVGGVQPAVIPSEALQRREKMPGFVFHLFETNRSPGDMSLSRLIGGLRENEAPQYLSSELMNVLTDLDGATNRIIRKFDAETDTFIDRPWFAPWLTFECVPNPDSSVHLVAEKDMFGQHRVALDWQLTDMEMQTVKRASELLIHEIGRLGIGRAWTEVLRDDYTWPAYVGRGKHHCGTTRMSADPKTGVVDADCRVHGMSNLYICSCSVFPTMGYANPTLTIGALAIRMADYFKDAAAEGRL